MAYRAHIATRRVLFIPGFDPAPARAHRERYRREGGIQAEISGYSIDVTANPGTDPAAWQTRFAQDGLVTEARIDVLEWRDLVRTAMSSGGALARTSATYILSGALFRLMRLRKGPMIAALYPVVALLMPFILAAVGFWLSIVWAPVGALGALILGLFWLGAALFAARWLRRRDGVFLAHYLMQHHAYAAQQGGAYPDDLDARLDAFAEALIEAAASDADEVLIVGHSAGAHLAVSALARALRSGRIATGRAVSLLTLGQVVPMVSFLPNAHALRRDLAELSVSEAIAWVDVTAPGDGCSFALCDPVSVSGVAPAGKRWPLVMSAAFTQTLRPQTWARLRWRFFRLHFQYLCAFDRPGDYDFFAITAGTKTLADRFGDRQPSASRIETPINRNRSLAA